MGLLPKKIGAEVFLRPETNVMNRRTGPGLREQFVHADQEDGHFGAGHVGARAEVAATAAGGDAFVGKLFDPLGGPVGARHVAKHGAGRRGRIVGGAMLRLEQEDGHLGAGHVGVGAEVAAAAAGGNSIDSQFFDPGRSPVGARHISGATSKLTTRKRLPGFILTTPSCCRVFPSDI